jgi:hypothetical protein
MPSWSQRPSPRPSPWQAAARGSSLPQRCLSPRTATRRFATLHHLRIVLDVAPAETENSRTATVARITEILTDDSCLRMGKVNTDGHEMHPDYPVELKTQGESKYAWSLLKWMPTTPAQGEFRPLSESPPLVERYRRPAQRAASQFPAWTARPLMCWRRGTRCQRGSSMRLAVQCEHNRHGRCLSYTASV